jgi:pyruvate,water dikinase
MNMLGKSDTLIGDALATVLQRGDFIPTIPDVETGAASITTVAPIENDPAIVAELVARDEASTAAVKRDIRTKSGAALIDFIVADIREMQRILFDPLSHQAIMAGIEASWWLNDHLQEWLGEKNAADTLTLSAPGNVTSEMGLALLDVADVIRPHAEVVAFLERSARLHDDGFLNELPREARDAIQGWLEKYGMRCAGEIDITRPRWRECPSTLLPLILSNIRNFEAGAGKRRFEEGRLKAIEKEQDLLERLRTCQTVSGRQKRRSG